MKRCFWLGGALSALLILPISALAADVEAGQEAYEAICSSCHGDDGISKAPTYPNLAGQKERYLAQQMQDFKSRKRHNPIMEPLADQLSDEDIDNIAAYLSEMQP